MKILELEIEGFRSLKKVVWRPGDLNVIIGRNGSGKSSLLRALELISTSAQGKLAEYISAAGGMKALVWDGEAEKICFKLTTSAGFSSEEAATDRSSFVYAFVLVRTENKDDYRIENEILQHFISNDVAVESPTLLKTEENYAAVFNQNQEPLQLNKQLSNRKETLLFSVASFLDDEHYSSLLAFADELKKWRVYSSLKTTCPIFDQISLNRLYMMYEAFDDFKAQIDSAMRAAFGNDFDSLEFLLDEYSHIYNWGICWKTSRHLNDVASLSEGALRYLFLLMLFLKPESPHLAQKFPSLTAVDEPETGLHPYTASIVAEFASDAARHRQIFFTTNSREFLSAFDRDSSPTVTVSRWVKGKTKLQVLEPARLHYWLKEYTLGELYSSGELTNMALDEEENVE